MPSEQAAGAAEAFNRRLADWLADVAMNPKEAAAAKSKRRATAGLPVQQPSQPSTAKAGAK